MGSIYRRIERHCTTCRKRLTRTADRMACREAGHTIEERQSNIYWIKYVRAGRGYDESSRSKRRKDAAALLQEREGDIARGRPITPRIGKVTFEESADGILADYRTNGKRSLDAVERRLRLHLAPYFGGWRMANITTADVTKYIDKRQTDGARNGQINLELANLKKMFTLEMRAGRLLQKPYIPKLREDNVRTGFFEPEQYRAVLANLPEGVRPVVQFAYITGWRINSEVLPLQWRQVDFDAGEVRLDAGTTKNREGRVFPITADLRTLLEAQYAEHERLTQTGHIVPWVFARGVKHIANFRKAWQSACKAAGCPGRIPHDLRRTAVRNLVRAGVPQAVAMKLTGHKTDSVFRRYDIVSPNDLRVAAERLNAVGGK